MVLLILFGFVAGAATARLAVRAAGAADRALGGRDRRPPPAARDRRRPRRLLHLRDRRARLRDRRPRARPTTCCATLAIFVLLGFGLILLVPPLAARVEAWLSRLTGRRRRSRDRRRRLLVGDRGRRQPRPRLRALRRADPRRGDHRLRLAAVHRRPPRGRAQLRARLGRGPLLADARRAPPDRAAGAARPRPADGDGRGDGRRRPGDARRTTTSSSRTGSPATCRASSSTRSKGLEDTAAARDALVDVRGEEAHGIGGRAAARSAGGDAREAAAAAPQAACRCSARRRNSSATSSWFNTPGGRPLTLRGPARPGRPGRLLDLQLHQLPPHAALPEGLGRALPQGRPDDRRRPLARVPLREGRRQRRRRDRAQRDPLPGRPGQRPGDLERLRQPVLAGRVLHRRPRAGPLRPLRRGRLRRERAGDPRAARRSRATRRAARSSSGPGDSALGRRDDAGDLPRRRPRRTLHQPDALARHRTTSAAPPAPGRKRIRLPRSLADHARLGDRRGRRLARPRTSAPGGSTSCSAPTDGRAARMRVLLDGQPIPDAARRRRRPRRLGRRSPRTASTTSSTCPRVEQHVLTLRAGKRGDRLRLHLRLATRRGASSRAGGRSPSAAPRRCPRRS